LLGALGVPSLRGGIWSGGIREPNSNKRNKAMIPRVRDTVWEERFELEHYQNSSTSLPPEERSADTDSSNNAEDSQFTTVHQPPPGKRAKQCHPQLDLQDPDVHLQVQPASQSPQTNHNHLLMLGRVGLYRCHVVAIWGACWAILERCGRNNVGNATRIGGRRP
jgi:hypothetical protein